MKGKHPRGYNCAGQACGVNRWVNPASKNRFKAQCNPISWKALRTFAPLGCTEVDPEGVSYNKTRCDCSEDLELIFYAWAYQNQRGAWCDYHMLGRDPRKVPGPWTTKDAEKERFTVTHPDQHVYLRFKVLSPLFKFGKNKSGGRQYIFNPAEGARVVKKVFCCKKEDMRFKTATGKLYRPN